MLSPLSRFIFGRRRFCRFKFRLILLFPIAILMFKMSVLIFEELKNEPYVTKHEQTGSLEVNLAQSRNVYGEEQRLLDGNVKKRHTVAPDQLLLGTFSIIIQMCSTCLSLIPNSGATSRRGGTRKQRISSKSLPMDERCA